MNRSKIGMTVMLALATLLLSGAFPMQSQNLGAQPSYCDLWPDGEGCGAQHVPSSGGGEDGDGDDGLISTTAGECDYGRNDHTDAAELDCGERG